MKPGQSGLIGAGGLGKSFLARMPGVLRSLGPIKATSPRVARRIGNSLRAGRPVKGYAELSECALVWIALPEAALDGVLREFSAEANPEGKMIVVCGRRRESESFRKLAPGARIATLDAIPGDEGILVAEGDAAVLREIRRLAWAERRRLIEIPSSAKALYSAAVHLASELLLPCFSAAVETLRDAGFSRSQATRVAEGLGLRTIRAYVKAGRKVWNAATAVDLRLARERDLAAIRAANPARAAVYDHAIQQALRYFNG
ncbi:MAG TPA: DUF2520 domain-containing protein [Bryobacteraceae bacterium]|jgi:predicted short-subunit dehydrogenase-like oxidoreductase (DUF2520 family)|nr:DUF2520 domain-containing protein [Bryobacteraceae bacterium]